MTLRRTSYFIGFLGFFFTVCAGHEILERVLWDEPNDQPLKEGLNEVVAFTVNG